jgi:hypothetical protein
VTTEPEDLAQDALLEMLQQNVPFALVVSAQNPRKVLGYVTREDALETAEWVRMEDERVREGAVGSLPNMGRAAAPHAGSVGVHTTSTGAPSATQRANGRESPTRYQRGDHQSRN